MHQTSTVFCWRTILQKTRDAVSVSRNLFGRPHIAVVLTRQRLCNDFAHSRWTRPRFQNKWRRRSRDDATSHDDATSREVSHSIRLPHVEDSSLIIIIKKDSIQNMADARFSSWTLNLCLISSQLFNRCCCSFFLLLLGVCFSFISSVWCYISASVFVVIYLACWFLV